MYRAPGEDLDLRPILDRTLRAVLKMIKERLRVAHGWTADRATAYLAACTPFWTPEDIECL